MDPDETLRVLRAAAEETDKLIESGSLDPVVLVVQAAVLVEAVQSLDAWMTRGGFAPQAWSRTEAAQQIGEKR